MITVTTEGDAFAFLSSYPFNFLTSMTVVCSPNDCFPILLSAHVAFCGEVFELRFTLPFVDFLPETIMLKFIILVSVISKPSEPLVRSCTTQKSPLLHNPSIYSTVHSFYFFLGIGRECGPESVPASLEHHEEHHCRAGPQRQAGRPGGSPQTGLLQRQMEEILQA